MSSNAIFLFFFLFSLRRRICSPFSSTIFLVLLAQLSSAAILFAENRYTKHFFSMEKNFLTKKKLFADFFPEVEKPCARFPQRIKMRKNGSTVYSVTEGSEQAPQEIIQRAYSYALRLQLIYSLMIAGKQMCKD